jgi:hypothetical protein
MTDSQNPNRNEDNAASDFADQAEQTSPGIIREFVDFLRYNKKWWLTPILLVLLLVGTLIALGGTAAAPFIYTLF